MAAGAGTMVSQTQLALNDAAEWLGDWHPLAEQLGCASNAVSLGSLSAWRCLQPVHDRESLRRFLLRYHQQILKPVEWRAIRVAHRHAERNELRELIEFDQALGRRQTFRELARPSRRVGRAQLGKLRPLRDHRFVQRYLRAVESRRAHGWHTLVYGVSLAVYSIPLCQGLLGYAHQITRGFIYAAARSLQLSEHECRNLFNELCASLPAVLEPREGPPVAIGDRAHARD